MQKVLYSLLVIGIVSSIVVGSGAIAHFSDVETSTGNTFTAGTLNLESSIASTPTLTGRPPATHTVTDDADGANDVVTFTGAGLVPGDSGAITWMLQNTGSVRGMLTVPSSYTADENSLGEPEASLGDTGDDDDGADLDGELDEAMIFSLLRINPDGSTTTLASDREITYVEARLNGESRMMYSGDTIRYTLSWRLPSTTTSVVQSDDLILNIIWTLNQF